MPKLKELFNDPKILKLESNSNSDKSSESPRKKKAKLSSSDSPTKPSSPKPSCSSEDVLTSYADRPDARKLERTLPKPLDDKIGQQKGLSLTLPFQQLLEEPTYIDKTGVIARIFEEKAKGLYLCFPRRSGKSTFVDFYIQWSLFKPTICEIRLALFENSVIMKLARDKIKDVPSPDLNKLDGVFGFNKFTIINGDFGCIEASNIEELKVGVIDEFLSSIQTLYSVQLAENVVDEYRRKDPRSVSFFGDLLRLIRSTSGYSAESAILIIDNLDGPVLRCLSRTQSIAESKKIMAFMNSLLHVVELKPCDLKKRTGIIKIILTGSHYPIGMTSSHLSRFRIDNYPLSDLGYCCNFFFSEEEVKTLIVKLKKDVEVDTLHAMFGNYSIDGKKYLHPGCVINYFQRSGKLLDSDCGPQFWSALNSLDILTTSSGIETHEKALWLLDEEQDFAFNYQEQPRFEEIMSEEKDHAFTYLLMAGYLTEASKKDGIMRYRIPNSEVKNIFKSRRRKWMKFSPESLDPFRHFANETPDFETFFGEINDALMTKYSYDDWCCESNYHVYLASFFDKRKDWYFRSNFPSGFGRYDFIAYNENKAVDVGYLFEIAYTKGDRNDDSVNAKNIRHAVEGKKNQVCRQRYDVSIPKKRKICVIVVGCRKQMYYNVCEFIDE